MPQTPQGQDDGDQMPLKNIRVPKVLWDEAKEAVALRGDASLSHVIRSALHAYVRETQRRQSRGDLPD